MNVFPVVATDRVAKSKSSALAEIALIALLCHGMLLPLCAGSAWCGEQPDDAALKHDKAALKAVPKLQSVPMPSAEELQAAIDGGIRFLLQDQNKDGSWGTAERTKDLNIFAPVPGAHHAFRTAVTALCICGLIDVGQGRDDVQQAIDRGEAWMMENLPRLRRAGPVAIYNVWGHGYAIQALARMYVRHQDNPQQQQAIADLIRTQYEFLDRYESVDGGWGYYDLRAGSKKPATDSTSFLSAAILVAFHDAQGIGVPPPKRLTQRTIDSNSPPTEAGLQLPVRRIPQVLADARYQPARR